MQFAKLTEDILATRGSKRATVTCGSSPHNSAKDFTDVERKL